MHAGGTTAGALVMKVEERISTKMNRIAVHIQALRLIKCRTVLDNSMNESMRIQMPVGFNYMGWNVAPDSSTD